MVFLQYPYNGNYIDIWPGHNPYFNRWFSAIKNIEELINSIYRHNPYFNRWFSAIYNITSKKELQTLSQSLF